MIILRKGRRNILIKTTSEPSKYMTNQQLLAEFVKYDKDNYNPLDNVKDKVVLIPKIVKG